MEKLITITLTVVLLASCSMSKENKANALIKEEMKKMLVIVDSYEDVETKLDSAFSPYDNPKFFKEIITLAQYGMEIERIKEEAKTAKYKMSLYSDSFISSLMKAQYQNAKNEYNEAETKEKELEKKIQIIVEKVKKRLQSKPEFIGYKAEHTYRAKNNAGMISLGKELFLFDKDIEKVITHYNMDGEEYVAYKLLIQEIEENRQ